MALKSVADTNQDGIWIDTLAGPKLALVLLGVMTAAAYYVYGQGTAVDTFYCLVLAWLIIKSIVSRSAFYLFLSAAFVSIGLVLKLYNLLAVSLALVAFAVMVFCIVYGLSFGLHKLTSAISQRWFRVLEKRLPSKRGLSRGVFGLTSSTFIEKGTWINHPVFGILVGSPINGKRGLYAWHPPTELSADACNDKDKIAVECLAPVSGPSDEQTAFFADVIENLPLYLNEIGDVLRHAILKSYHIDVQTDNWSILGLQEIELPDKGDPNGSWSITFRLLSHRKTPEVKIFCDRGHAYRLSIFKKDGWDEYDLTG